ncbi:SBP domain-containing protein [Haematococcus lacustris]
MGGTKGLCQVEGCGEELAVLRDYHQRYKICEYHLKVPYVVKDGVQQRFCQQCGRFQPISEFEGVKRSCRARLQRHNDRRRKRPEDENAAQTAPSHPSSQMSSGLLRPHPMPLLLGPPGAGGNTGVMGSMGGMGGMGSMGSMGSMGMAPPGNNKRSREATPIDINALLMQTPSLPAPQPQSQNTAQLMPPLQLTQALLHVRGVSTPADAAAMAPPVPHPPRGGAGGGAGGSKEGSVGAHAATTGPWGLHMLADLANSANPRRPGAGPRGPEGAGGPAAAAAAAPLATGAAAPTARVPGTESDAAGRASAQPPRDS